MSIFSFIFDEITGNVSQVAHQADACEQIVNQIRTGLQPIMGGAWIGQGAQAFIQETNGTLIPEINQVIAAISSYGGSINMAFDIISQADDAVFNIVNQLGDIIDAIF